ncbi:hypothetical protein HK105_205177 [Polyrhizophydium stewartii]|uniref:Xylanolytic transcriptional activator regulatory domain-containing protein n=1 Tax=Polyrhizophydium stewartii TaxID=2732419 RepID=A0ABR4N6Z7_9FUNG
MEDLATILDALNPALLPTISDDKPTIFDTICGWRLPDDGLCAFGMPESSPTSTPSSKSNAAASASSAATNPPVREQDKRAPSSDASALSSQTPRVQPTGPPSVTSSNIQDAPWAATLEAQLGGGDLGLELLNSLVPPGIGDGSASAGASAATSHTSVSDAGDSDGDIGGGDSASVGDGHASVGGSTDDLSIDDGASTSLAVARAHGIQPEPAATVPELLAKMALTDESRVRLELMHTPAHRLRPDAVDAFEANIAPRTLMLPFSYIRERLDGSPLASQVIVAIALNLMPDTPPHASRPFFEAALASVGSAMTGATPMSVVGLLLMSGCVFYMAAKGDMPRYMACAVRVARDLGLNTEAGVAALADDEDEREALRRIWWSVVSFDANISSSYNKSWEVAEQDCLVHLPRDANAEPATAGDAEIRAMSSTDWSVAPLPSLSVEGSLLTVQKIMRRVFDFTHQSHLGVLAGAERVRVRAMLDSSLRAWHACAPDGVRQSPARADWTAISHAEWRGLLALSLFHFSRINLWRKDFNDAILASPSAALPSRAVAEVVDASNDIAQLIIKPVVDHAMLHLVSPFTHAVLLAAASALMVALKLPTSVPEMARNAQSLEILIAGMSSMASIWKAGKAELALLDHVATFAQASSVIHAFESAAFPEIVEGYPTHFDAMPKAETDPTPSGLLGLLSMPGNMAFANMDAQGTRTIVESFMFGI